MRIKDFLKCWIVFYRVFLQSCYMFHSLKIEEMHLPHAAGWIASVWKAKRGWDSPAPSRLDLMWLSLIDSSIIPH